MKWFLVYLELPIETMAIDGRLCKFDGKACASFIHCENTIDEATAAVMEKRGKQYGITWGPPKKCGKEIKVKGKMKGGGVLLTVKK